MQGKDRWDALNYRSYTYETRLSCNCGSDVLQWSEITVQDGRITRVFLSIDQTEVDPAAFNRFPTIEDLFLFALTSQADELEFELDPETGYPTMIRIPDDPEVSDDEYERQSRNLVPMTNDRHSTLPPNKTLKLTPNRARSTNEHSGSV